MADQTQPESPLGAVHEIEEQLVSPTSARHSSDQFAKDALLQPEEDKQYASISISQVEVTKEANAETDAAEPIHNGIYKWSPIAMVTFFFLGILTSFMHHFYYTVLDGQQVGNDRQQQWALRGGNAFAYLTQVSLTTSLGFPYAQWLWWALKRSKVSVAALDAAFDGTLTALLNMEMVRKIKMGTFLALMIGLLPLTSLVPPATLFVLPSLQDSSDTGPVCVLDMYGTNQWSRFAHSSNSSDQKTTTLLSPRTIIKRLSSAVAAQGETLPISAPFPNASLPLQFFGPSVMCEEANSTIAAIIDSIRDDDVRNNSVGTLVEKSNYFYAFVPDLITNAGNTSAKNNGVLPEQRLRLPQPQNASNELWMAYSRYTGYLDSQGNRTTEDRYLVCKLYNASYNILLKFEEGTQEITNLSTTNQNVVEYPKNDSPVSDETFQQHAYSAVFWAMTDLLVGSMGFFVQNTSPSTNFTEITTNLQYISLIGSSDLQAFFDSNHPSDTGISDQRKQDIELAHNRTLDVLIPELMFNITTSFMSSNLLSPPINKTVTREDSINRYVYHSKNLFLSYGLAIGLTFLANLLGAFAYWDNGVSHNKGFSAILAATRHETLTELFHNQIVGSLPLSDKVKEALLRFGPIGDRRKSLGGRAAMGFTIVKDGYGDEEEEEDESFRERLASWVLAVRVRLRVLLS